jgi:hypothetical protein
VGRQPLLVIAGWLGAAVLAMFVGLAATNVIGNGLTTSAGEPVSQAEVDQLLAVAPPTAPSSATPSTDDRSSAGPSSAGPSSAGPSSIPGPAARTTFPTRGGTITAECVGARVHVLTMTPIQGYSVHDRIASELQSSVEAEFRSDSDNHDRVKVDLHCVSGKPVLTPHDDDND